MLLHYYCPVGLVLYCHFTILQLLKKWQPFCTKGGGFYHENFSKQYSVQYSEEIPGLNDTILLHLLLDGGHFGLRPP